MTMVLYDEYMAPQVDLPDEAPDVTASELHVVVLHRLLGVLRFLFRDQALVMGDTFVRVNGVEQVSPDVMIVPGAEPGTRTVYRIPPEPVPDVTIEVLSPRTTPAWDSSCSSRSATCSAGSGSRCTSSSTPTAATSRSGTTSAAS